VQQQQQKQQCNHQQRCSSSSRPHVGSVTLTDVNSQVTSRCQAKGVGLSGCLARDRRPSTGLYCDPNVELYQQHPKLPAVAPSLRKAMGPTATHAAARAPPLPPILCKLGRCPPSTHIHSHTRLTLSSSFFHSHPL
jgi:hypothetical protein